MTRDERNEIVFALLKKKRVPKKRKPKVRPADAKGA